MKVAVKVYDTAMLVNGEDRSRVLREIRILKKLQCPYIVQLFEVIKTPSCMYIVMDFVSNGSLLSYVRKHKRIAEVSVQFACGTSPVMLM
eukprot:scaffold2355_cov382-Prasinococcus_capsulatus_cf.AAC.8